MNKTIKMLSHYRKILAPILGVKEEAIIFLSNNKEIGETIEYDKEYITTTWNLGDYKVIVRKNKTTLCRKR